jgi:UDPglucose--hexose-1-phosphate uridylyltransferase
MISMVPGMSISFRRIRGQTRLRNPMKGFSLDEIPYEIRYDPLTGESGRVFNLPFKAERPEISSTVQHSKEMFCPFCPEALERSTPLFPDDVIPEGRIVIGNATLIPNLVPFDKYAGVSIFSGKHFIAMEDLTPETMHDAFTAALTFVRRIADVDPLVHYFSINWNYMPAAGSSIVHPHLQPNCGEVPTNQHRRQLEASRRYFHENGRTFWEDLLDAEKAGGERYIGEIGSTCWVMSFVPLGFLPDLWCVFRSRHSFCDMEEQDMMSFLRGLSAALRYFNEENVMSFNLSMFSVREGEHFRVNAKVCPRLFPRPIRNNDMAHLQVIHKEPFTVRPPELACPAIRDFFPSGK